MTKKGFTLIELLVVIAIIAILAAISLTIFQGVSGKARDAKRKQDLRSIAAGLEAYYQTNSTYILTADSNCSGTNSNFLYNNADFKNYMANQIIPLDPKDKTQYCYYTSSSSYRLCAVLENSSDTEKTTSCPSPYNFTVTSQNL